MPIQDLTPHLRLRLRKVEWIAGLFLAVTALLMLGGFLYFLKRTADVRGWFITYVPYYTYMSDATGFKEGTPVRMMGFPVGEVTKVTALELADRASWDYYQTNDYNVFVAFKVKQPYYGYIGADSKVRIGGFPVELAGGNFLELSSGTVNSLVSVTLTNLPNGKPGVLWEKFAYSGNSNQILYGALTNGQKGYYLALDKSETLLAQAQRILKNADEITAFLRHDLPLVAGEAVSTMSYARTTVGSLTNDVVLTLTTARQSIAAMTNDVVLTLMTARQAVASLTNDLNGLIANTRRITGEVADVLPGLTNDIARTLSTSQKLMDSVNQKLPEIAQNLNLTLTNLNVLLLRDTNITANTSMLVSNVNNLITRHWMFRSAFKSKGAPPSKAVPSAPTRPENDRGESSRPRRPGELRGAGRF